jgi:tetratricopeptide (TPR) repeat protein
VRSGIRIREKKGQKSKEALWEEWEKRLEKGDWEGAMERAGRLTEEFPEEYFGWENLAWTLHRSGQTREAYEVLAPLLKELRLPAAPSGRAAYFLACFSAMLGKGKESERWLRLALALAAEPREFLLNAIKQPELSPLKARMERMLKEMGG